MLVWVVGVFDGQIALGEKRRKKELVEPLVCVSSGDLKSGWETESSESTFTSVLFTFLV